MKTQCDVIVVGGGASGLLCAVMLARKGVQVTVLEKNHRIGKKLSATGNGRCNFTNLHMNENCYYGNSEFISHLLTEVPAKCVIAEFEKYGVMHRNTYINSTKLLDNTYNFKQNTNIFFAGQITGVEGYVESISSGLVSALNAINKFNNINTKTEFSELTMIGALAKYISTPNEKFQPMNANFGILPQLNEKIRDKKLRYEKLADRSLLQF